MPPKVKHGASTQSNDDGGWGWTIDVTAPDGGTRLYRLPQPYDPTDDPTGFARAMAAARADAGMPADADPIDSPWQVSCSPGEPHPSLLRRATLVDWSAGVP